MQKKVVLCSDPTPRFFMDLLGELIKEVGRTHGLTEHEACLGLAYVLQERLSAMGGREGIPNSSSLEVLMRAVAGTITGQQGTDTGWAPYLLNKLEVGYTSLKSELTIQASHRS